MLTTGPEIPLDLIFYNYSWDCYGAHIGVLVGDDSVLHLCAEVGYPIVWSEAEFGTRERYQIRLGARRILPGT